jgi:polysaccharide pyruvyl transferase WcaK-like protein
MVTACPALRSPQAGDAESDQMSDKTLTFLGNFGTHNLGNECTLQSIIQNARKYLPGATLRCICPGPEDASSRYNIPAFRMSYRDAPAFKSKAPNRQNHPVIKWVRRLVIRLPLELVEWLEAFRTLKGTNMLIMPGTGMLGDFGIGPFDLHYQILKWSIVARIRRCKLLFVSVGAGPIDDPLSRWIVKSAITLADYRSYRDSFSRQYLDSLGFDTSEDHVYPDLAFSFPATAIPSPDARASNTRIVGLGLMDYYGKAGHPERGAPLYQDYIAKVTGLVTWLLKRKYCVRLLIGDLSYDTRVKGDLFRALEENDVVWEPGQIIDEPVLSVEQLWAQLAQTDMVVATRFHNILLALMLNKPVIALSYHEKIESLMAGFGLEQYCHRIGELDVETLAEQFRSLEADAKSLQASIRHKTEEYRKALDDQYRHIFTGL